MSDLIDREAALDAVRDYPDDLISQLTAIEDLPSADVDPCDVCKYNPPSSMDGKPCTVCPAEMRTE